MRVLTQENEGERKMSKQKRFLSSILLTLMVVILAACSPKTATTPNGEFIVGMECGYAPYNWTEPTQIDGAVEIDGGQYCVGYDVSIAQKIADDLGRTLVVKKMPWEGLILSVQSNQIDAIIAGMSPTEERRQEIEFSEPYYVGSLGVIVPADSSYVTATTVNDFKDMRVAAQMGTFHVELMDQLKGAKPLDPMKDFPTMTVAAKAGEIDGFVSDESTGKSIQLGNADLVYIPLDDANGFVVDEEFSSVSIGMKKNNPLVHDVNAALAKISQEERTEMMDHAINQENDDSSNFFAEVASIFSKNKKAFISGTMITLLISVTATVLGFFLGLLVSIVRGNKVGGFISNIYIGLFRGTPMMVQSMLIYYGIAMVIPGFKWANIPYGNLIAGIFIVTINTGAYMAETIRSGIQSLDKGQFEAAQSLGFTKWQTMTTIILPQAIKNIIPAIGNELIVNIKDTSVLNVIMVSELFYISNSIASSTYKIFQTFVITSLIYLFLTTIATLILRMVERKLDGPGTGKKVKTAIPSSQTTTIQIFGEGK